MLFLSFLSQKTWLREFLRPEVILSRSYQRNCSYDNLTLKLHQEKHSYPDERWLFIGRFKAGSVLGRGVFLLAASKKVSKSIHPNKVIIAINSPIYK